MKSVFAQLALEERADNAARSALAGRTVALDRRADRSSGGAEVTGSAPLAATDRAYFEPRFGWNFADVRVHAGEPAAKVAREHDARALTVGRHVFFGAGEYAPDSAGGRELLAHELAHVVQQATIPGLAGSMQRQPNPPPKTPAALKPDYVHKAEGFAIAKYTVNGIDFRVGVAIPDLPTYESKLTSIAAEITKANALISDAAMQVNLCAIAPTVTRYATYGGKPVLALDLADADADTARHEMGHAVFAFYRSQAADPKSNLKDVPLVIADIFARLKATKDVEDEEVRTSGTKEKKTHPAGLWIVDPPQWSTRASEHPWDDPDEFSASARKAFLTDKPALKKAIAKFTKADKAVASPAADLLNALQALETGKAPKKPKKVSVEAEKELKGLSAPTKIEDTLGASVRKALRWALDPSTMPGAKP
jgi:hypothetical protein